MAPEKCMCSYFFLQLASSSSGTSPRSRCPTWPPPPTGHLAATCAHSRARAQEGPARLLQPDQGQPRDAYARARPRGALGRDAAGRGARPARQLLRLVWALTSGLGGRGSLWREWEDMRQPGGGNEKVFGEGVSFKDARRAGPCLRRAWPPGLLASSARSPVSPFSTSGEQFPAARRASAAAGSGLPGAFRQA